MKSIVVADAGPLISLAVISKANLLFELFSEVLIAEAVWEELVKHKNIILEHDSDLLDKLSGCKKKIQGENYLSSFMDYGESESVILYKEQKASYLVVDDKKARKIAESMNVECVGTLGILTIAKEKKLITELKPLFEQLLKSGRYFSIELLNSLLAKTGESPLASS